MLHWKPQRSTRIRPHMKAGQLAAERRGQEYDISVCESGDCSSFSMLEVLCLVPVALESSFRLWNGVLVNLRDPSSRSFSTSSSPLANLASRLSRPQFLNTHIWIGPYEVSARLRKINGFVPDFGGMKFHTDICTSIGLGMAFRRRRSYVVSDCSFASVNRRKEQCLRPSLPPSA